MKPAALSLIATILMYIATLSVSHASQRSMEMNVTVMSRGEVDPTMLKADMYAYAAYKADGIEGAVWGSIKRIHPDGIVIESETEPLETRKMSFGDVDILVVTEDRLTFESWLDSRLATEKITVMSRNDLELTKLATGSYAHVVYTWRGFKRKASGKILEAVPDGIVVESGAEPPETVTIGATEIDTIACSSTSQALERWRRWNKSGIVGMSRWDLNPSMLKEGLHVHVVYNSGGQKREAVGRIVDRYTDRIVIQHRVGGKNSFVRRQRLKLPFDDIEAVIVSRDKRARTSDLLKNTIIFLHLAH